MSSAGTVSSIGRENALSPASRRELLAQMIDLREFDLACERWWKAGEPLVGEFHLSLGQEAFTIGTCAATEPTDLICPSIRGMGAYLSRGVSMVSLIASFLERSGSISEGRWAHWHSPVQDRNILPQTGMLGSGLVTAVGVAMAQQIQKTQRVVVAMVGDGTTNTGYFHEGVNLAAVRQLPIIFVIENNQYAVSTPISATARVADLSKRAVGYGIPGVSVDGNDVEAVCLAVREGVGQARQGGGPTLIELKGYRWGGQTIKDPDRTRDREENLAAKQRCPIALLRTRLIAEGNLSDADFESMFAEARGRIDEAERQARALPLLSVPPNADLSQILSPYAA